MRFVGVVFISTFLSASVSSGTLYVVWQQDRLDSRILGTRVGIDDAFRSVTAPGSNIFLVKTSFWIPIG